MPTQTISRCGGSGTGGWNLAILETSPDALWKLNETSGTTAFDTLAGHHDAFVVGVSPTLAATTAPTGDVAPYFTSGQAYRTTLATYNPTLTGDFSAAVWIQRLTLDYELAMGQDSPEVNHAGWQISAQQVANPPGLRLMGEVGDGGTAQWYYGNTPTVVSQWYWVVITHSGTTWTLYINGTAQTVTYGGAYTGASTKTIWIGQLFGFSGGTIALSWAMLWATRALSAAEITAVWATVGP